MKKIAVCCMEMLLALLLLLTGCTIVPREEQMFNDVASNKYPYLAAYKDEDLNPKIVFNLKISEFEERLDEQGYPVTYISSPDYALDNVKEFYFTQSRADIKKLTVLTEPFCLQVETFTPSEEIIDGSKTPDSYIAKIFICYNSSLFASVEEIRTFLRSVLLCVNPGWSDSEIGDMLDRCNDFIEAIPEDSVDYSYFPLNDGSVMETERLWYSYDEYLCPEIRSGYCEISGISSSQCYKSFMICPEGQDEMWKFLSYPSGKSRIIK